MAETGTQFVLLAFAAGCLVLNIRHFQQKGFLWNNAWLFASEQERKHMDKAPHYRQSAIVFALLFLIFLLLAAEVRWKTSWLLWLVGGTMAVTLAYAVASSVRRV